MLSGCACSPVNILCMERWGTNADNYDSNFVMPWPGGRTSPPSVGYLEITLGGFHPRFKMLSGYPVMPGSRRCMGTSLGPHGVFTNVNATVIRDNAAFWQLMRFKRWTPAPTPVRRQPQGWVGGIRRVRNFCRPELGRIALHPSAASVERRSFLIMPRITISALNRMLSVAR